MLARRELRLLWLGGIATMMTIGPLGCAATDTPTMQAGRGKPSLTDPQRPAAWIYIDGKSGQYAEVDGQPTLQWVIDEPVSATPTFRVDIYQPLLKKAGGFDGMLTRLEPKEEKRVDYLIAAGAGAFSPGTEYSLVEPGEGFVLRSFGDRKIIEKMDPLAPGTYMLVGSVRNAKSGKQALAVTTFTVAASEARTADSAEGAPTATADAETVKTDG